MAAEERQDQQQRERLEEGQVHSGDSQCAALPVTSLATSDVTARTHRRAIAPEAAAQVVKSSSIEARGAISTCKRGEVPCHCAAGLARLVAGGGSVCPEAGCREVRTDPTGAV